jgi:hypothetical protein
MAGRDVLFTAGGGEGKVILDAGFGGILGGINKLDNGVILCYFIMVVVPKR